MYIYTWYPSQDKKYHFLCSQLAVAGEDYTLTSGTLTFANKELSRSFFLQITNDMISEVDEYVFVAITSVQLDTDSVENVDNSGMSVTIYLFWGEFSFQILDQS